MLSNIVLSEEIIMSCKYNYEYTYVFKYSKPIVGKKKVYQRHNHEWVEYCTKRYFQHSIWADGEWFDDNGKFRLFDIKHSFNDTTSFCEYKDAYKNKILEYKDTLDFLLLSFSYSPDADPIKCKKLN